VIIDCSDQDIVPSKISRNRNAPADCGSKQYGTDKARNKKAHVEKVVATAKSAEG
jgi:hypothetical protein